MINYLTFVAEIPGKSLHALTLAFSAAAPARAIRDLALVMAEAAFFALPSGVAFALAVFVVAVASTKQRTSSYNEKVMKMESDSVPKENGVGFCSKETAIGFRFLKENGVVFCSSVGNGVGFCPSKGHGVGFCPM